MTPPRVVVLETAGVALSYWLLYRLNEWLFSAFDFTAEINWIFLPAAIRMISVLLFGWRGVGGLFIGTLVTSIPLFGIASADTYVFPLLSSGCPMLAILLGTYLMNVKADLAGVKGWQLLAFALLGAAFNSLSHNLYFQFSGGAESWLTGLLPMFVGDLAGALIVLYAAAGVLRLAAHSAGRRA